MTMTNHGSLIPPPEPAPLEIPPIVERNLAHWSLVCVACGKQLRGHFGTRDYCALRGAQTGYGDRFRV